jgi:hypothetical protein
VPNVSQSKGENQGTIFRIPKGFRHLAQGCRSAATLGKTRKRIHYPEQVAATTNVIAASSGHNLVEVGLFFLVLRRVARSSQPLGWRPKSPWDSLRGIICLKWNIPCQPFLASL